MKATLDFWWVSDNGSAANAPGAQLILYPKYPEVRLSGFLKSCATAPSSHFQVIKYVRYKRTDGLISYLPNVFLGEGTSPLFLLRAILTNVVLTGYRDEIGELPPAACETVKDKNLSLLVGTVSGYYEPDGADCIFTSIKLYDRKRKVVDGKEVEPDFFMI